MKNISAVSDSKDIVTVEYIDNITASAVASNAITINHSVSYPLLSLTIYGQSWEGERIVNVSSVGIEGYGIAVDSGGNYIDPNGQHWICDELIVNADGSGKLVKRCEYVLITAANIISMTENASFGNFFYTNIVGAVGTDENSVKPLSNRFLGVSFGQRAIAEHVNKFRCFLSQDGRLILRNSAADNRFTSVAQVQDFVAANETYAIYPLAEYSETELTAEQITAVKPAFEHYGAFTACFKSTQENEPSIDSPAEIITSEELHRISVPIESIGGTGAVKLISTDGESETTAEIVTGLPLRGVPVSNGGNYTDESGQEWICDSIEYDYTTAVKHQRVAVIDSYNGEAVGENYISTTGGLDVGATIIYPAETVTEATLTADEINQLRGLVTFDGVTSIYNSENADMAVEYLTSKAVSKAVMPIITVLRSSDVNA